MTIYQGLQLLEQYRLPHPEWEFVMTSADLKHFYHIRDYVGWTIRTVEIRQGKWRNLYLNWIPKREVPDRLDELQHTQQGKALFVVYPSWKWRKGGTLLLEKNREIIEVVRGGVEKLMREGKIDASYIYQKGIISERIGNSLILTPSDRKSILTARKVKRKGLIFEWVITTQGKFIFYRVEDISEAAKLLIIKYS